MERLTEREPYWLGEEFWTSAKEPDDEEIDNVYAKLKEYEDLEEQGLLLRFLCKVGDTVFFRDKRGETILPVTIENIHSVEGKCCIEYFGWFFNGYGEPTMGFTFTENDFGKTVFLTKEEAETKLKELEGSEKE